MEYQILKKNNQNCSSCCTDPNQPWKLSLQYVVSFNEHKTTCQNFQQKLLLIIYKLIKL